MAWSYDADNLTTDDQSGRINVVRFLVGDTDTNDQLVQNEEVIFALGQTNNNVYYAAAQCAMALSSKFARKVDVKLDGALSGQYDGLSKKYRELAFQLKQDGLRNSGRSFSIVAGGLTVSSIDVNRQNTNRVQPSFRRDRFKNGADGTENYYNDYE